MSVPTILLIEDNPAEIELLRRALKREKSDFRLDTLADGEAALHFIDEHRRGVRKHEPCVILLDLHLPKHDGLEVLRAIQREPDLKHIRVIVLSSFINPSEEDEVKAAGALCQSKPRTLADYDELAAFVWDVCRGLVPAYA